MLLKKALSLFVGLAGVMTLSASQTQTQTLLYQEDWGTTNGGANPAYALNASSPTYPFVQVGWSIIVPAAQSGTGPPYEGIYQETGAYDNVTGYGLPLNAVYYTTLGAGEVGFLYTTAGAGSGGYGDSAFPAGGINPASYPGLTFNAEVSGNTNVLNYFAVQVGGEWYVSTTALAISGTTGGAEFADVCLAYTTNASAWDSLTVVPPNTATIGSVASANLSGSITGFGIVEVGSTNDAANYLGWDYNEVAITTSCGDLGVPFIPAGIVEQPVDQITYAGGGVSFAVQAAGTMPTYSWYQNAVALTNGGRISGANTAVLTITNVNAADATATYSVEVSNDGGADTATSTAVTLTVNPVPTGVLYAETVPYMGPTGAGNLGLGTIGWGLASINGGIYDNGGGSGAVFAYTGAADTVLYYTDTTTDTNQSGLAFPVINPANYPQIAFETLLDPNSVPTDVTAYFAVEMKNASGTVSNWYVYGTPIDENLTDTGVFQDQQLQFTTNGSKWNNLTFNATSATIGSQASGTLTNNITGAGLVFTFNGGGGDFNWDEFQITTNLVQAVPPVIGDSGVPWSQAVYSGGGVSYEVTTQSGTQPFTYSWTLNGVTLNDGPLPDGAIVSGSKSPTLTLAGVTTNEVGGNGGTVPVIAFVHNSQGTDESDTYFGPSGTTLTVNNPPIGTIYTETFPFLSPSGSGNYAVSDVGWTEAYYQTPASLYDNSQGDGAVFVYDGTPGTIAYYTDTLLDTNQSGLPFPNIDPAGYPGSLTFNVDLEAGSGAANVTAYWAVALKNGGATNWYASATAIAAPGGSFATTSLLFNPAAANWDNLAITPSGATVGAPASSPLSGVITGAGLVFVITGSGGDINFDNFTITGSGLGDVDVNRGTNGSLNLTWVGNPAVELQSSTNLNSTNWQDIPASHGLYYWTIANTNAQKYFRLATP